MKIIIHDGGNTIGGNKISVCSGRGECFLLDFGVNFARWGNFFEEFLNPRTGKVVEDLIRLKLIPEIPVYRDDLAPKHLSWRENYKFVFLSHASHAHADHVGLVGLLSERLPLLATSETFTVMEIDSVLGKNDVWRKVFGAKRRSFPGENEKYVRMDLKVGTKDPLRRVVCADGKIPTDADRVSIGDLWEDIRIFKVYHSVIGASALAVPVDGRWIIYTGDFRVGPMGKEEEKWIASFGKRRASLARETREFLNAVKDLHPSILIIEGTRITRGEKRNVTEKDVFENTLKVVRKAKGLVLVDFPVRHLERLLTFLRVAMEVERKLVLTLKDFIYLVEMGNVNPAWRLTKEETSYLFVYYPSKLSFCPKEKEVLDKANFQGILIKADDIGAEPHRYMLSSGYWSITDLLDFDEKTLSEAIYIHSTSEAYTEEQQIDVKRFWNWLRYFQIEPYGIEESNGCLRFTGEFHASGHASPKEIEETINQINPEIIIPIHTLDKKWFVEKWGDKVYVSNFFLTNVNFICYTFKQ